MPPISVLMKPSSGMCNLACTYCFYCDESNRRAQRSYGFMTEQTLKNIIRKTLPHAKGIASYAFQGGEPTLRGLDFFQKAVEYQQKYNTNAVRVQNALQTNGYLLNESWCRFLNEYHFLVGISVDGTQAIHDAYRRTRNGDPTYDRVLHATKLMDKFHVDYNILTVVTNQVAAHCREIYQEYRNRGWHYQQYIPCLDPMDTPHGQEGYALLPEEYGHFLIQLFHLWYQDCLKGRPPYIRQFENYLGILAGYVPEACDQRGKCGLQYVVEADGGVYPCDFYMIDGYYLGNFNLDRLLDLDKRREKIGFIERSQRLPEECRNCRYHFICRGGCQRNRDLQTDGTYSNYFCRSYKMFFETCLEDMKKLVR